MNEFGFFLKSKIVTETFKWRSLPFRKIILIVTWSIDACESRLERGNPVGRVGPTNQGIGGECFGRGSANRKGWILDKVGGKLVRICCSGIEEDSKSVRFLIWSTLWMLLASLIGQLVKDPHAMQETTV